MAWGATGGAGSTEGSGGGCSIVTSMGSGADLWVLGGAIQSARTIEACSKTASPMADGDMCSNRT
jgi:hypothetical protein